MRLTTYLKEVLQVNRPDSVKSLVFFLSAMVSCVLSTCLGVAMIIDVAKDGVIDMNLSDAGLFMLCLGGFMTGSGVPKIMSERGGSRYELITEDGKVESVSVSHDDEEPKKRKPRQEEEERPPRTEDVGSYSDGETPNG